MKPLIESNKVTATATVSCQVGGGRGQDFPGGVECRQLPNCFAKFLPKAAWKWKNLDREGRAPLAPLLDPPLVAAVVWKTEVAE